MSYKPTESGKKFVELNRDLLRQYIDTRSVFTAWEESRAAGNQLRTGSLNQALIRQQRMNWALRVGSAPRLLVEILMRIYKSGLADRLVVVGPCSLYAYEALFCVRFLVGPQPPERKRVTFIADDVSIVAQALAIAKRADKTFESKGEILVNNKGFEFEVMIAEVGNSEKFSAIIVAKSGHMSRMYTRWEHSAVVLGFGITPAIKHNNYAA